MRPDRTLLRRLLLAACGAWLLFTAGCDSFGGEDDTIIRTDEVEFEFRFATDSMRTGELYDLLSENTINIEPILRREGFSTSDVRHVTVRSARLKVALPVREEIAFLSSAVFGVESPRIRDLEVGSRSQFPSGDDEVLLDIRPDRNDITAFALDEFGAYLQFNPRTLLPDTDYSLGVQLDLEIQVEGF